MARGAGILAAVVVAAGLVGGLAAVAGPSTARAATAAQRLGDGQAMYPRVIRLQHSGAANGHLIASVSASSSGGVTDMARFFESTDAGASFHQVGTVSDPQAAAGRGSCCGSLFELPRQLGTQPAGTLLFATTVGMPNAPGRVPEIRVWSSTDQARTWTYLSSCASAPAAPAGRGLWEPELSVDSRGALDCFFSDDSRPDAGYDQTLSVVTSTDGGLTWGAAQQVVAIPSTATATWRPGMATIRQLPNGTFFMAYELCGTGIPDSCEVRYRTSADGWNWGDPTDPGTVAETADGRHLFHAPTVAWIAGPGANGRLLLVGDLVKDAKGRILRPASGTTILANTENGAGKWYEMDAPVGVSFPADPGQQDIVCDNYSSSLLPSADGASLLEVATMREANGGCGAYFNTGTARGTGDATGVGAGTTYRARSVLSGHCLDVSGGSTTKGAKIEQWNCNQLDPQNWKFASAGGGYFTLTSEQSGLCLDVPSSSTTKGTQLQQWTCNGSSAQLWHPVNVGRGTYTLVSKVSGLCLDVKSGSPDPGAAVQQWTCNNTAAQLWHLEHPLVVMPLGDSITDGLNQTGGYRSDLWQLFGVDGRFADFVGSQYSGPATLGDWDHEGHPGWRIDQVDAQITGWLNTYRPDAVLLHLGTNDVIQDYALDQAPNRLSALIDHITAAAPNATVYVATIIPFADPTDEAQAEAYDAAIPGIVQAKAAAGRHVQLVDLHPALGAADLADGVHPTNGGYSKMAARWYAAVTGEPATRWEAEAAANTLTDSQVVDTANASGNRKVGHLDNADSSVDIAVTAPAAGRYRLYVRAGNGTGTPCGHTVTVNGQAARELTYPSYGWDQWAIVGTDVTLAAGANTIRFAHSTCYAELDSIDLAPLPPSFPS
ncbi:MAG: RICIN domain-containing protein [Mycobacteriales bacterium]